MCEFGASSDDIEGPCYSQLDKYAHTRTVHFSYAIAPNTKILEIAEPEHARALFYLPHQLEWGRGDTLKLVSLLY